MELIKRNIHMDRVKRSTVIQFTMEEDLNLPEDKPDISTLNLEKGEVVIEEIRPGTDEVTVRGKLGYAILYHTQETGSNLVLLSGALPFEEKIHMEGTLPSDTVAVNGTVEDFTVNMINSRKLNLQALLLLTARIEEIYDEELPVGIQGGSAGEGVEYRISPMEVTELSICKNDIFRKKRRFRCPPAIRIFTRSSGVMCHCGMWNSSHRKRNWQCREIFRSSFSMRQRGRSGLFVPMRRQFR